MSANPSSPGVYVVEVPAAVQAIVGVGTSTAGFIGAFANTVPAGIERVTDEQVGTGDGNKTEFDLAHKDAIATPGTFEFRVDGVPATDATIVPPAGAVTVAKVKFTTTPPAAGKKIVGSYNHPKTTTIAAKVKEPKLCTTFTEFTRLFGDFSADPGQRNLAHAVAGFFNNGGSRCYVMRVAAATEITRELLDATIGGIDEIAIVAAPGLTGTTTYNALIDHCEGAQDRFAILDTPMDLGADVVPDFKMLTPGDSTSTLPRKTSYAALYFPWLQVFDPVENVTNPKTDPKEKGRIYVPPSGHVAGIYARVDTARGVHKAPANEAVRGATGLRYRISRNQQDVLNPQGVNAIRDLNGAITVWGARTVGGSANGEFTYISTRRLFNFLRESIEEGMQWVVFEPNEPGLWAKITRNVTAFLTNVWRSGALFGATPAEAFYVKCDANNNPPDERELGRVVTEIGVAIVRPAEFVIFKLSQWAGPGT